jgi:hypothetical protein
MPAATIKSAAAAMIRRGAAMASHAIRCSGSRPFAYSSGNFGQLINDKSGVPTAPLYRD